MRLVYEASSALEAHMILNLLEQAGLSGRVDGEYLQGGAGELQVGSVVRVMVEEKDYVAAREIIDEWDAHQVERVSQRSTAASGSLFSWTSGLVGFICGIIFLSLLDNTPVVKQGIDHNQDGIVDERHVTENGLLIRTEFDRDFDGQVDKRVQYDRDGTVVAETSDDDFNGYFETHVDFIHDQVRRVQVDTDGDTTVDRVSDYAHGVLTKSVIIDTVSGKPIKIQYFNGFSLVNAELDSDGDQQLDTRYDYDKQGEIVSTSRFGSDR